MRLFRPVHSSAEVALAPYCMEFWYIVNMFTPYFCGSPASNQLFRPTGMSTIQSTYTSAILTGAAGSIPLDIPVTIYSCDLPRIEPLPSINV